MVKKLTTQEFIKRAKEIHGDKYDYSMVEYEHSHKEVKIICNNCLKVFNLVANGHINIKPSRGKASGCYNCFKQNHSVLLRSTDEEFIKRAFFPFPNALFYFQIFPFTTFNFIVSYN